MTATQLVVIIAFGIIREVCGDGLANPPHYQQADSPTQRKK